MSQKIKFDQISTAGFEDSGEYVLSLDSTGAFTWAFNAPPLPWTLQGTVAGYSSTGPIIFKIPYASDTGCFTCVGPSTLTGGARTGHSSASTGYAFTAGGGGFGSVSSAIDKFSFADETQSSGAGNLSTGRMVLGGSSSETDGYVGSGRNNSPTPNGWGTANVLDKFPFASSTTGTCIGTASGGTCTGGTSAPTAGYMFGGINANFGNGLSSLHKFPFVSDGSSTSIGSLTATTDIPGGANDADNSYAFAIGTGYPTNGRDVINKWPHAADVSAVATPQTLVCCRRYTNAHMSTENAYIMGDNPYFGSPMIGGCTVEKFPFASETNVTCTGCLASLASAMKSHMI